VQRAPGEGSFTGDPKRYVKYGSGMGVCFQTGPALGNMEGCSFLKAFKIKRCIKRYVKMPCMQVSLSIGAPVGNLEGIHLPECFERMESISGFLSWTQRILSF
jgi:hypothetical protein